MPKLTQQTSAPSTQQQAVVADPVAISDLAPVNLETPTAADMLTLQQTIGNRAVNRLIQRKLTVGAANDPLEAEADAMANRVMSGAAPVQREGLDEEDTSQAKSDVRRQEEDEELLQAKPELQRKENKTGLPDNLKMGIESLSGMSMDDVRVHYNSDKPAQLNALAYAQGTDIHVAPGQEKQLPHEAWHVVQQEQGRTDPMPSQLQMKRNVQREVVGEEEEDLLQAKPDLQRSGDDMLGSFDAGPNIESRVQARTGSGNPLPGETRDFMESRMGADFGNVRVHTDSEAAQISRDISAQAFTYGNDVYFDSGKYNPGSDSGKHLLAHELTHVVQQGGAARKVADTSNDQLKCQIQRDAHGNNCTCPICSSVQRKATMAVQRVISTTPDIQREETDSASASGVHGSVQVAQAATVDSVRSAVGGASPGDIPGFLAARVQELKGLGISAEVEKPEDLIPVLAADMKRKNAALSPDQQENLSDEQWSEAAKGQIEGNKTTALTTSDDRYTAIKGGASFDELHEFIHICSAPGGASALMQFNLNMNEGAINYFSELTAAALGTAVIARYPEATVLVTKLVNMIGANGPALLYSATFKGDVNGFFNAVGDVFSKSGDKRPNGTSKFASEKGWTAASAADEFKSKVRAWNLKWLEQRV